jgi:hypothetical protein
VSDDQRDKLEAEVRRREETKDFLQSLTRNDELLKPIYNPEAWIIRDKLRGAASRNELPRKTCRHPFAYLQQYEDSDPSVIRKGLPLNLFECKVCGTQLWLVDGYGDVKPDG